MKNSIYYIGLLFIMSFTPVTPLSSQFLNFVPRSTFYQDLDGDGYGNPFKKVHSTTQPKGYVLIDGDCDDTDAKVTSGILFWFYEDRDGDGLGNGTEAIRSCYQPKGYVIKYGDCNDQDASIGEGPLNLYFRDLDGDGYGDENFLKIACQAPLGYVQMGYDCDDSDPKVHKGVISTYFLDEDGDGYGNNNEYGFFCKPPKGWAADGSDCDDHDPLIGKGDIKGYLKDNDQDGYGDWQFWIAACDPPLGYTLSKDGFYDCDDHDKNTGPGYIKIFYIDRDHDGHGDPNYPVYTCIAPDGFVDNSDDCDDANPEILGARYFYIDKDQDGYGDFVSMTYGCQAPKRFVDNYDDCDDNDKAIGKGVNHIFWLDNDRDGLGDAGHSISICKKPKYYVDNSNDCDDYNPNILGGRYFYQDNDQDGYGSDVVEFACKPHKGYITIPGDCNDKDPNIHPEAKETCNGIDDNCNGSIDEGKTVISIEETSGSFIHGYLCSQANPIVLKGKPEGGIFSIDGIQTTVLDPANFKYDGIHKIEYAVWIDGCLAKIYVFFKKFKSTEPIIYGLKDSYDQRELPIEMASNDSLFAIHGNSPYGVFSIDGIKTKILNPALLDTGIHKITFTIIESGCLAVTKRIIHIRSDNPCPLYPNSGTCYQIINRKSKKVLSVRKSSLFDGAIVIQSDNEYLPNQKWTIQRSADGTYSLLATHSHKQIEPASVYLGSAVIQKDLTSNTPTGSWKIECTDRTGYYKIVSVNNGHVLDIMARSDAAGAQAITWYWTNTTNQYWQIVPVNCSSVNPASATNILEPRDQMQPVEESDLMLYPVPAHDYIKIKADTHANEPVVIYDQTGRLVYTAKMNDLDDVLRINLNNDRFSPGLYLIQIGKAGNTISKKFIVN